ncbi:MAG: cytochrome-c peroxidase [Flammeovirgaceae bacterium]|nr:MAG: cytochrome-c peroxidase [Flammeovirgaceae bacterium]
MCLLKNFAAFFSLVIILSACEPFESGPSVTSLELPRTPFQYNVPGASDNLVTLGRVLFYDTRLSVNNAISCASCHKQVLAFSDNVAFSRGFQNKLTLRNSMPIQNIISDVFADNVIIEEDSTPVVLPDTVFGYLPGVVPPPAFFRTDTRLFWDGRETSLESMVTRPIMDHIEMGMHDLPTLAKKLKTIWEYQHLFTKAFPDEDNVTPDKISLGLSAFLLSIRSSNSKVDRASRGEAKLSASEEFGQFLFTQKFGCDGCHALGGFANIGLDALSSDPGLSSFTGNPNDAGKFKIPALRNVQLTAPYMHDGRFKTLEQVLDHYSSGIKNNPTLDGLLRTEDGKPVRMNMTAAEKAALISFLNALTDHTMITDPRFSNPFKQY